MESLSIDESPTRQSCLAGLSPATQWDSYLSPQERKGFEMLVWEKSRGEGSRQGDIDDIGGTV